MFFFFLKQKTAYEMRISDWSSDVCSSDLQVDDWGRILSLGEQQRLAFGRLLLAAPQAAFLDEATSAMDEGLEDAMYRLVREHLPDTVLQIGRASCRERVCQDV